MYLSKLRMYTGFVHTLYVNLTSKEKHQFELNKINNKVFKRKYTDLCNVLSKIKMD